MFELVDVEPDRYLTGLAFPAARLVFGPIAGTYLSPRPATERHGCSSSSASDAALNPTRATLLTWGDLLDDAQVAADVKDLAKALSTRQRKAA